jgi:hypothetical protein
MARGSFKKLLLTRIQEERDHRGVSGSTIFQERSDAPNPRHMVAFSSDDLPALRSGRRPGHSGPPGPGGAAAPGVLPAAPIAPPAPSAPAAAATPGDKAPA